MCIVPTHPNEFVQESQTIDKKTRTTGEHHPLCFHDANTSFDQYFFQQDHFEVVLEDCAFLFFPQRPSWKLATAPPKKRSALFSRHSKPNQTPQKKKKKKKKKNGKCAFSRIEQATRFGTDCRTFLSFVPNGSCCGTFPLKNNSNHTQLGQSVFCFFFFCLMARPLVQNQFFFLSLSLS